MSDKKLSRRDLAKAAAVAGLAASAGPGVFAAGSTGVAGTAEGFGSVLIPPEYEGKEKHAPVIEAPAQVKVDVPFQVSVTVGKEKRHPNTTAHHIKWIQLFAKPEGKTPVVHIATFDLGPTFAEPQITVPVMLAGPARLYALAYCNIHGIWESSVAIKATQ